MREHNIKLTSENQTDRLAARVIVELTPNAAMKILFLSILPFICFQALAAEPALQNAPSANDDLFRAHELTLDVYSSYTAAERNGIAGIFDTNARHGKFGAGL